MDVPAALLDLVVFALGAGVVARVLVSAIRTFVLPRAAGDGIVRWLFLSMRRVFIAFAPASRPYEQRDRVMAYYAPVSLLLLPFLWLALVMTGYTAMFWAVGGGDPWQAFRDSGSSLLTLGFEPVEGGLATVLAFSEAGIGLLLLALLISYVPSMYGAFTRREVLVNLLEVRADSPPSAVAMIRRFQRLRGIETLHETWVLWEPWFAELEETHTTLPILAYYRSPTADRSWITAAGVILDAAALQNAAIDVAHDAQADLTLRSGYLALRRICDFFRIAYDPAPRPDDATSVTRSMFETALDELAAAGVPLKSDRDRAWLDFNGWRVNYDRALLALSTLTMAPPARWNTGDERAHFGLLGSVADRQMDAHDHRDDDADHGDDADDHRDSGQARPG